MLCKMQERCQPFCQPASGGRVSEMRRDVGSGWRVQESRHPRCPWSRIPHAEESCSMFSLMLCCSFCDLSFRAAGSCLKFLTRRLLAEGTLDWTCAWQSRSRVTASASSLRRSAGGGGSRHKHKETARGQRFLSLCLPGGAVWGGKKVHSCE